MNDSQLRRLLAERSPWRARPGWAADWRREALTMKARHGRGVMVTRSPPLTGPEEPIWAIPAAAVAWLLGH